MNIHLIAAGALETLTSGVRAQFTNFRQKQLFYKEQTATECVLFIRHLVSYVTVTGWLFVLMWSSPYSYHESYRSAKVVLNAQMAAPPLTPPPASSNDRWDSAWSVVASISLIIQMLHIDSVIKFSCGVVWVVTLFITSFSSCRGCVVWPGDVAL